MIRPLPFLAVAALVPGLFTRYRMSVSAPVAAEDQGDFVPQFATSPVALEMHPEQVDDFEEGSGDENEALNAGNDPGEKPPN